MMERLFPLIIKESDELFRKIAQRLSLLQAMRLNMLPIVCPLCMICDPRSYCSPIYDFAIKVSLCFGSDSGMLPNTRTT